MANLGEPSPATQQYLAIMTRVRLRFETINQLRLSPASDISGLETAAFHLRKIIEGIAFGCMVALQNGLKDIPRDARGQWNADTIFARLAKRDRLVFPEPFTRQNPPDGLPLEVAHHLVPDKTKVLTVTELREIYRDLHAWLHEWNPYVEQHHRDFEKRRDNLLNNVNRVKDFIWQHLIGIGGEMFLGFLKDPADGDVRIVQASSDASGNA